MTYTDEKGRVWRPYSVHFDTCDGKFSFVVYALSPEHAEAILDDVKSTAAVVGEIVEVIKGEHDGNI